MTKAEIVSSISQAIGLTKVDTEAVVNGFIYSITDALKNQENVEIRGSCHGKKCCEKDCRLSFF